MKPLWKVKGFFNRTSWKVPDVEVTAGPREDGSRTTVAQLAELGTQNQQLHQALQQVQQQQSQQQGLVQAPCQTYHSPLRVGRSTSQSNLVGHLGKPPPLKNKETESCLVHDAQRTSS